MRTGGRFDIGEPKKDSPSFHHPLWPTDLLPGRDKKRGAYNLYPEPQPILDPIPRVREPLPTMLWSA